MMRMPAKRGPRVRRARLAFAASLAAALLSGVVLVGSGCSGPSSVTVGVSADDMPLAARGSDDAPQGFLVELTREAAQRMGMSVRFSYVELGPGDAGKAAAASLLDSRKLDAVWMTDGRNDRLPPSSAVSGAGGAAASAGGDADSGLLYTAAALHDGTVLAVPSASRTAGAEDLAGKAVGALRNSDAFIALKSAGFSLKGGEPVGFDSSAEAYLSLDGGGVDALAVRESEARNRMTQHAGQYRLLSGRLDTQTYSLAVRRNDSRLRDAFNRALAKLQADGTAATLSKNWFDTDMTAG